MLRKGFSENTIKAFRNDLKILSGFMESDVKLYQISTQNLEDYLAWMQSERNIPCSAKTLARRITSIKVFFGWLHGIGVLGTDPAEPVAQQPARPPLPVILRDQDVSRLVRAAQDYLWSRHSPDARPYLLVSLLLQTGMKKAECSRLLVTDFNFERPQAPEVTIRYAGEEQAHKNRILALNQTITPVFNQYVDQYKPDRFPLRLHAAQPRVRARRSGAEGRHSQHPGRFRDPALDVCRPRLSHRHARRTPAPEAGSQQNLVARNPREDLPTRRQINVRLQSVRTL